MNRFFMRAAMALAVATVSAAGVFPAYAQDLQLRVGPDGIRPEIRDRDRDRRDRRGGCSEREARAAARDEGLLDPEVVRVTPRTVVVEGRTRRGLDRITFANERGCPEF